MGEVRDGGRTGALGFSRRTNPVLVTLAHTHTALRGMSHPRVVMREQERERARESARERERARERESPPRGGGVANGGPVGVGTSRTGLSTTLSLKVVTGCLGS